MNLHYFENKYVNLSIDELSSFLEEMDTILIDPIGSRSYFSSYRDLAKKFLDTGHIIVCKDCKSKIVGLAVFYADSAEFELAYETYIGVLRGYHRKGIARELLRREIDLSRKLGMKGIMTNCNKDNQPKINLNIKLGFQEIVDQNEIDYFLKINPKWAGKTFFKLLF